MTGAVVSAVATGVELAEAHMEVAGKQAVYTEHLQHHKIFDVPASYVDRSQHVGDICARSAASDLSREKRNNAWATACAVQQDQRLCRIDLKNNLSRGHFCPQAITASCLRHSSHCQRYVHAYAQSLSNMP